MDNDKVVIFRFGQTLVQVWPGGKYLETRFKDNSFVPAAPQDNDEYRARARELGYGDDTWSMCVHHELFHTMRACALGLGVSPTLWAVAHKSERGQRDLIAAEEAEVLNMQRKFNIALGRLSE